jgi:His-Xaa-Ser system radical SAM maturase HxsC
MTPLHTHAVVGSGVPAGLLKIVGTNRDLPSPGGRAARWIDGDLAPEGDWDAFFCPHPLDASRSHRTIHSPRRSDVVAPGDVIRVRAGSSLVSVLYRRGANANALFVTERCNSYCLMCSQPPRDEDDSWRLAELLELVDLIDPDLTQLGITGGEPTLLGQGLVTLLAACRSSLPRTRLHVLTNARRFCEPGLAGAAAAIAERAVTWAVPLYADVASRHDYIVQAHGAFAETLHGIYNLAERGQAIEIRFVLHKESVPRLEPFAEFLWRNLPFVDHVAFMGLEPMGFAKLNRERLWIDPVDYALALERAVLHLSDRGMSASLYNLPLCVLPRSLWPFARKSISDWKNTFVAACEGCSERDSCAGFFSSAGVEWVSRGVRAIRETS